MKLIKKIICISLTMCIITSFVHAFSFTNGIVRPTAIEIKKNIEKEYGLNVIMPQTSYMNMEECMAVVESSLSRFPKGVIKEITDSYLSNGIKTNIIINKKKDNSIEKPADYEKSDSSANITINILSNNFYATSGVVSLDGTMLEISRFICDYLYVTYGYDKLKLEFEKLNYGFEYGSWAAGYDKVFVSQNSATNFNEDICDLVWYAVNHSEKILNINLAKKEIIHKKIELLANVFDEIFKSITVETKLWIEAIPSNPDDWAVDEINKMFKLGLIPKEFEGKYDSYISREDFCTLALNIVKVKIGENEFYEYFDIEKPQKSINIDPVNGEVIVNDEILDIFYDINLCKNKEDIYEAYKIGLINDLDDYRFGPEAHITRIEAAKISASICEKFGIDIATYNEVNFDDISQLEELDMPYMYFVLSKGILKGYSNKIMPYECCTYQEAYIIMNRVYALNK